VTTFLGVCFYDISGYIRPIGEYYECFGLVAIYYLFMVYVTPLPNRGAHPFVNLEQMQLTYGGASLTMYNKDWLMVLQIIPVRFITLIAGLVVSGSECKLLREFNPLAFTFT
jgi:hypothetical protein